MFDDSFQKIQIFLSCRNLKDLDFFSKSDPYVKVGWRRDFNCKNFIGLGKTQTLNNNLNPTFSKSFVVDYIFQSKQDIRFDVFDDDGGNDDFIGTIQTTIGALMGAKNQTSILDLKKQNKGMGKLIVRCQKIGDSGVWYEMKWKAKKLMNTDSFFDFWDKSDPYLKFLKIRSDNSMLQAYRTDVIKDNLNPNWKQFHIQGTRLHQENNTRFKLQCWDWQQSGKDQFIGEAYLDLKQLQNSSFPKEFPLSNPKSKKPGTLILQNFRGFQKPTFVDYIRGGLELNMIIAVDFTASNGVPKAPTSLHFMDPKKPNQYQTTIQAVAQILLNYDSDKRIPAFGFGAKTHFPNLNSNTANHCFPLSGDFNNLDSFGLQHLLQLYSQSLQKVELAGPTYFGPIIEEVAKLCYSCQQSSTHIYQTLLILTDGEIHDMDKTVDLIVKAGSLPLSIIIVGIGKADFANMERLDGDNGLFDSHGRKAQRDIVQFVPFREVQYNPDMLAKQLLGQLPDQVVQYFQSIGVQPRQPPKQQSLEEMVPINTQQNTNQQVTDAFNKANFFNKGSEGINPYGNS